MRAVISSRLWLGGMLMLFSRSAVAENAVTTDVVSVRAGPDSSYPEVAQLDADTPIQVMGCLDDWSWCDVGFADSRGWLYAPDITYQYEGGYVPFYTYAPVFGLPVVTFSIDTYWGSHYHDRPWYAQREEWVHRPINHQRPSGPPPRREPPPRDVVRAERPHGGAHPGESMRLSKAPPAHTEERGGSPRPPERVAPPPPAERNSRPEHAAPPPSAERSARPERAAPPPPAERNARPPEHAAPPPAERNARSPEHASPPAAPNRAEPEARKSEPAQHKPEGPPRKQDDNDRRG
jgi:uncharacterized protein YraI